MQLERIVTLASARTELQFRVLERSLRATGSRLPISVIPYDHTRFSLPTGSTWWIESSIFPWLEAHVAHPMMKKYQCLTTSHYQYVDTDCVFMRDPEFALNDFGGFVVCCGHWRDTSHTLTRQSHAIFKAKSTNWQRNVFNAGQFASECVVWTAESLKEILVEDTYRSTTLDFSSHDQPGMNLLVHLSGVPITNLTLPPTLLESSWAGDYSEDWRQYWEPQGRAPYLVHWAGLEIDGTRPIDQLYLQHFLPEEREVFRVSRRKHAGVLTRLGLR